MNSAFGDYQKQRKISPDNEPKWNPKKTGVFACAQRITKVYIMKHKSCKRSTSNVSVSVCDWRWPGTMFVGCEHFSFFDSCSSEFLFLFLFSSFFFISFCSHQEASTVCLSMRIILMANLIILNGFCWEKSCNLLSAHAKGKVLCTKSERNLKLKHNDVQKKEKQPIESHYGVFFESFSCGRPRNKVKKNQIK